MGKYITVNCRNGVLSPKSLRFLLKFQTVKRLREDAPANYANCNQLSHQHVEQNPMQQRSFLLEIYGTKLISCRVL